MPASVVPGNLGWRARRHGSAAFAARRIGCLQQLFVRDQILGIVAFGEPAVDPGDEAAPLGGLPASCRGELVAISQAA